MKKYLFCFLFILPLFALSQVYENSMPLAFQQKIDLSEIKIIEIENFDISKFLLEDEQNILTKPYSFAQGYDINVNFDDENTINYQNYIVKYAQICISGALSMAINFSNYNLKDDEKIFVFSPDKRYLLGAFTSLNNKNFTFLQTQFIPSDTIIIEYQKLKNNKSDDVQISGVAGAYRPISDGSDWCEINVNCDSSELWQTVKKSVAKIIYKDDDNDKFYICTGSLVANTKLDDTPYFLTANHCINSETEANSAVFYFNYEATDCAGDTGDDTQTISGASLIATADDHLDFTLLRLSTVPPEEYEPYYVGWSRMQEYSDTAVAIHHPSGDIKKISKTYEPLELGTFSGYDYNKHWQVTQWDEGTTEGGSSGSGLFTVNGLLIGTLSGGEASCDYNKDDLYQQFYHDWDDYNELSKRLDKWLDTFSFAPLQMAGYYPYENLDLQRPTNLFAQLSDSLVTISWSGTTPKADKYLIYRNLELLKEVDRPQTLYDILTKDNVYVYYVTAIFGDEESKPSNMESLVFGDTSKIPKVTEIRIFPNPTAEHINIITPDTIPITKVEIYNYDGRIVLSQLVDTKRNAILNVADLPNSWYIMKIYTTGDIYHKKFIKIP